MVSWLRMLKQSSALASLVHFWLLGVMVAVNKRRELLQGMAGCAAVSGVCR